MAENTIQVTVTREIQRTAAGDNIGPKMDITKKMHKSSSQTPLAPKEYTVSDGQGVGFHPHQRLNLGIRRANIDKTDIPFGATLNTWLLRFQDTFRKRFSLLCPLCTAIIWMDKIL